MTEEISDEDLFEDTFNTKDEDIARNRSRTPRECYKNETHGRKDLSENPNTGFIDILTGLYEARDEVEFRRAFRRILLRILATLLCGLCLSMSNLLFLK